MIDGTMRKNLRTADFEQLNADTERLVYVNEFIVTRWLFQSCLSKLHDNIKPGPYKLTISLIRPG